MQYLIPNRQGTDTLAVDAASQAVTRRQYTPFGQARGTTRQPGRATGVRRGHSRPTTDLENLGAREYDAADGRFISPDPVLEADPNQTAGYDYAGNDPVTGSDPSGLMYFQDGVGAGSIQALEGEEARIAAAEAAPPSTSRSARRSSSRTTATGSSPTSPTCGPRRSTRTSRTRAWGSSASTVTRPSGPRSATRTRGCATAALATRSFATTSAPPDSCPVWSCPPSST
ncbi:hypothetical protein GXW82_43440 [Streptacidiphilus sp. 4-A2]|nr:hypothetical protein [Streptacidiphilus sp. 4-A2]